MSTSESPLKQRTVWIYVDDIHEAYQALTTRGLAFDSPPHRIHRDDTGIFGPAGSEEWLAFFRDPDGHLFEISEV